MDMKKILQTLDAKTAKPAEGKDDMKKFLQIVESKGPLNRLTPAESITLQHYTPEPRKTITNPVLNVDKNAKLSMTGKYFKEVEVEFLESEKRYKDRAKQLAERVSDKMNGFYFDKPKSAKNLARAQKPPENIDQLARQSANRHLAKEETEGVDSVTLDVPLMIRLLEFAREDANDDMILHKVVERMIGMKEEGQALSMSDYENIVGKVEESHGNSKIYDKCWKGYKKVPGKKRGEPGSCEKK